MEVEEAVEMLGHILPGPDASDRMQVWWHRRPMLRLSTEVLAELSNRTTCILGHTRWPTRGTPAEPLNNQPIHRGRTLGTHNGTILNSTPLALAHGIRRLCQVDTEVLVRLANDLDEFLGRLRAARVELSAVLVRLDRPSEVALIRGNKPLAVRYHALCATPSTPPRTTRSTPPSPASRSTPTRCRP